MEMKAAQVFPFVTSLLQHRSTWGKRHLPGDLKHLAVLIQVEKRRDHDLKGLL